MFNFIKNAFKRNQEENSSIEIKKQKNISKDTFEEILLEADVNYALTEILLDSLPDTINRVQAYNSLISIFQYKIKYEAPIISPFVEMIVGVNGAGKTTTISKLANMYKKAGKSVMLGAGDTFRAAAIEQLSLWATRLNIPIVSSKQGGDPSAVVFDSISSAKAKNIDNLIIDTAGRLHTQTNLAGELQKMVRIADKAMPNAPHRKLLILDGTQGSSSINQAKAFNDTIEIDGIIVTKLDGTAKGGSLLSIAHELQMPIFYIGIGEKEDDLIPFKANAYVNSILDEIFIS